VRVVRAWQAISRLAHKGAALGLVVLVLLPGVSTADDLHTCTLHGFPAKYRSPQLYDLNPGDESGQSPCLACYWQSITDSPRDVDQLRVEFHPLGSLPLTQHTATQPGTHPVHRGRAPPLARPS